MLHDLPEVLARIEGKLDTILSQSHSKRPPLIGVKAIILYLNISRPTLAVYQRDPTCPIRKLPSGKVVALPDALDTWVEGLPR